MHRARSIKLIPFIIISGICVTKANGQTDSLRMAISAIAKSFSGQIGVAVIDLDNYDTITYNGHEHFPMQSLYKFPLALAVLHQVDQQKRSLDQKIHIRKKDLLPGTWSPLRDKYPNGDVDVSLREILSFTVSQSDNNGCDILFRLMGGTQVVEKYIHNLGVKNISIAATEEEMHKKWNVQYSNWCEPLAMAQLFNLFYKKDILSRHTMEFLWQTLVETVTGPQRIKGLLPATAIVAHKTGTGGRNNGITSAINDAGVVILPNKKAIALTVFISDTPANDDISEAIIAKISKTVYDYYTK